MKSTRLAALFAALALTLAMATTALANGTVTWQGNGTTNGTVDNEQCDDANPAGTMLWVFTTGGVNSVTSATLYINGVSYGEMEAYGQNFKLQTAYIDPTTIDSAYVIYVGSLGSGQAVLTISHYCPGETTTTTTTAGTETESTTTGSTTATATTTTTDQTTSDTDTTTSSDTTTSDTTTSGTETESTTTGGSTTTTASTESETTSSGTESGETTTTTSGPTGSVEELTPPPTDASAPGGPSGVSTGMLLFLAGILSLALVVTPAFARSRRR